jgi:transposase
MSKKRKTYSPEFKANVVLAAVKNEATISELAARFGVHPTMITAWKRSLLEGAADIFDKGQKSRQYTKAHIDEQYLKTPSWGSRFRGNHLRRLGYKINRKKVQRLMRLMGLEAIYPKPKTSRPHPDHKVYSYLLRNLTIDRPNQVWAADSTYIPMNRGFMYLVAVMD